VTEQKVGPSPPGGGRGSLGHTGLSIGSGDAPARSLGGV
jgi:hypothetical protein